MTLSPPNFVQYGVPGHNSSLLKLLAKRSLDPLIKRRSNSTAVLQDISAQIFAALLSPQEDVTEPINPLWPCSRLQVNSILT